MELLDAAIALALTLAALATVVTVIMEIVLRGVRMRKRNLVQLMRMLNEELPKGTLGLEEQERWEFFKKVVENPAQGLEHVAETLAENESAGEAMVRVRGRSLAGGLYDKVSTEHVLRRLSELPKVRRLAARAADKARQELYRIACKYEELGAAVSASFKRRSQFWSIIVGVALAIVANVHGVRIFEAYVMKPELARVIVAQERRLTEAHGEAEGARAAAREASGRDIDTGNGIEELEELVADARRQVASLVALGVPIGNAYFPHCRWLDEQALSATCAGPRWPTGVAAGLWAERLRFLGHVALWLVPVVITGMLIGLGAPFWFDVAKRLAEVRSMFGGTASAERRLAARDSGGDPGKRDAIVRRVVRDAADAQAASQERAVP